MYPQNGTKKAPRLGTYAVYMLVVPLLSLCRKCVKNLPI
jgi:hypothetical protein